MLQFIVFTVLFTGLVVLVSRASASAGVVIKMRRRRIARQKKWRAYFDEENRIDAGGAQ